MHRRRVMLAGKSNFIYEWDYTSNIAPPKSTYRSCTFNSDYAVIDALNLDPFPNHQYTRIEITANLRSVRNNQYQLVILTAPLYGCKIYCTGGKLGFTAGFSQTTSYSIPDRFVKYSIEYQNGIFYAYADDTLLATGVGAFSNYNTKQGIYNSEVLDSRVSSALIKRIKMVA